jgi:hypothetical protein
MHLLRRDMLAARLQQQAWVAASVSSSASFSCELSCAEAVPHWKTYRACQYRGEMMRCCRVENFAAWQLQH